LLQNYAKFLGLLNAVHFFLPDDHRKAAVTGRGSDPGEVGDKAGRRREAVEDFESDLKSD
jgi:hypothetical protein